MAKIAEVADAFGSLISVMSQWFDKKKNYYVNMLKVLYRDHIKDAFELHECSKTMDIINLLIRFGHLNSTNLTLLYQSINLTQQFGLEHEIKVKYPSILMPNIKNMVITAFTLHRQRLVKLGMELDPKGIERISGMYSVAEEHAVDSWCLIMDLEQRLIICEEDMDPFIKNLKKLELPRAVKALTEREDKQERGTKENNEKVKKRQEINGNVPQVRTADCLKLKAEKSVSQGQTIVVKVIKTVPCDINADQLKVEWTHPSGIITITTVEEDENGEYSTRATFSSPGVCRLDVSAGGVALKTSPMTVEIKKDGLVKSFSVIDTRVTDIVVEYDDCLLVSCERNKILKFKLSEEDHTIFPLPQGAKVNRMHKTKNGDIAFSDKGNRYIKVCNINGKVISTIGQGLLKDPRGIYVNKTANVVYVADFIHHCFSTRGCVYKFDIRNTKGKKIKTIGKGILKDPVGIQVNETSNVVYVTDSSSFVYMFNIDNGNMFQKITQEGRVCDIALTSKGNLFVFGHSEIKLFSNEGKFIKDIKTEYMQSPLVAVDEDDNIIVSGFRGSPNCLKIFSSNGNVLKTITFEDNDESAAIPKALCIISHHPRKVAVALQYNVAQLRSSIKIIHY